MSNHPSSRSALIFTGALVQHLENQPTLRLPSTYIGVRRVRPTQLSKKRKLGLDRDVHGDDDAWVPNDLIGDDGKGSPRYQTGKGGEVARKDSKERMAKSNLDLNNEAGNNNKNNNDPHEQTLDEIEYKVTDPDGTARRMTRKEKRELKYKLARAKHLARKEERQTRHKELINEQKAGRRERQRAKKIAWMNKKRRKRNDEEEVGEGAGTKNDATKEEAQQNNDSKKEVGQNNDGNVINDVPEKMASKEENERVAPQEFTDDGSTYSSFTAVAGEGSLLEEELVALRGERRGIPPVMLAPAATCVAQDAGALSRGSQPGDERVAATASTVMDPILSGEWAKRLRESMAPAEASRARESMRPMAYRLVPEAWKRLCPASLWYPSEGGGRDGMVTAEASAEMTVEAKADEDQVDDGAQHMDTEAASTPVPTSDVGGHSFALLRSPSPAYDEDAYAIFRHLHRRSNLHVACGALFGCDFLLYDGRREDRHSFAGLRVYSSRGSSANSGGEPNFPVPTPYDMTGFVRTMNAARKIALVATVARDGGGKVRVAIVDLALEKVLEAPTHVRKGNTSRRRSEEEAASGLARTRS